MVKEEHARIEFKNGTKKLDQISSEILVTLVKHVRGIEGDMSILHIDPEDSKIQAYVKEHNCGFWYIFDNGKFKLYSCSYKIKRL